MKRIKSKEEVRDIMHELIDRDLYRIAIEALRSSKMALEDVLSGKHSPSIVRDRKLVIKAVSAADVMMSDSMIAKILRMDRGLIARARSEAKEHAI